MGVKQNISLIVMVFGMIYIQIVPLFGQTNHFKSISYAIELSDAKELAYFFHPQVDLTILGKEYNCSKKQAEFILKKFFLDNSLQKYTVVHHGEKEKSNYIIGKYETNTKFFRIYLLIKKLPEGMRIFQIRIEDENEEF
jgi:hypothetical protein